MAKIIIDYFVKLFISSRPTNYAIDKVLKFVENRVDATMNNFMSFLLSRRCHKDSF